MHCRFCDKDVNVEYHGIHNSNDKIQYMYRCVECNKITYSDVKQNIQKSTNPPEQQFDIFDFLSE